jgi:hypothetical protein
MALNYKSFQFESTASQSVVPVNCNTTSCLVRSATVYNATGSDLTCIPRVQKSGEVQLDLKAFSVGTGQTVSLLIEPIILENGDQFKVSLGGAGLRLFVSYVESTAVLNATSVKELSDWSTTAPADGQIPVWDNASGQYVPTTSGATLADTGGLPEQSSGTEPLNRYMKNLDALDPLTDLSSSDPEDVLSDNPGDVNFVVENNTLSPAPPQKVTFEQIIQALMAQGLTDIANDPNNNLSLATFTGSGGVGDLNNDGQVSVADLLSFLTYFGSTWTDPIQSLFTPSVVKFTDSDNVILDEAWTTLSFAQSDFTVTAGTQNVIVDYTTNHDIKFASQTSPYLLRNVPYKEILLSTHQGNLASVITQVADQEISVRVTIDLFNVGGTALGGQGYFDWTSKTFKEAGTSFWLGPGMIEITSSEIATQCSVTDGLDNTSFDSVVVKLQAKTNGGGATLNLNSPRITLRQNYIPE